MEVPRSLMEWQLLSRLHPPIPDDLIASAERAIDLTRAGHGDYLVEIRAGASLPAGELVEQLGLDELVDRP